MMKPDRMRRLWRAFGAWGHRDPTLFIAFFATSMILTGISLLASTDTFGRTPVYSVAADLGWNDNVVGATMVVNALIVFWALGDRLRPLRSFIMLLTGILWCFWGFILLAGALRAGFLSSGGASTVLGAAALMRTSAGFLSNAWPRPKDEPRPLLWDDE